MGLGIGTSSNRLSSPLATGSRSLTLRLQISTWWQSKMFTHFMNPLSLCWSFCPSYNLMRRLLVGHRLGGQNLALAMEKFPEKIVVAVFLSAFMRNTIHRPSFVLEQALYFDKLINWNSIYFEGKHLIIFVENIYIYKLFLSKRRFKILIFFAERGAKRVVPAPTYPTYVRYIYRLLKIFEDLPKKRNIVLVCQNEHENIYNFYIKKIILIKQNWGRPPCIHPYF